MVEPAIRVYADTSVYGGIMDEEFQKPTRLFFDAVAAGRFGLVVSPVVANELEEAPQAVRTLFRDCRRRGELIDITEEAVRLQQAYIDAGIVTAKWETDALHVALAAVSLCRLIVSWNFRHIVNFRRIPLYNGVSLARGYGVLGIHTPQEVISCEDEDV